MYNQLYILAVRLNIIPIYYRSGLVEGFKWFGVHVPLDEVIVGESLFGYIKRKYWTKEFFTLGRVYVICTVGLIALSIYLQVFPFCAIMMWTLTGIAILLTKDRN